MSDDGSAKRIVLARRARFLAAAMAGAAVSGCGKSKLDVPVDAEVVPADPSPPPAPCLTAVPVAREPVPDAAPPPAPCLRVAAPKRDAGCDPHDPLCVPPPDKTR